MAKNNIEWSFKGKDVLNEIVVKYNIQNDELCLIGGMCLAALDLRSNNDVDIVVSDKRYNQIKEREPDSCIWNECEILKQGVIDIKKNYYTKIGISDQDILQNDEYYFIKNGYRVIRPELVFATKNIRQAKHDLADINLLYDYAKANPQQWNWKLVKDAVPGYYRENYPSGRLFSLRKKISTNKHLLKHPGELVKKIFFKAKQSVKPFVNSGKTFWGLQAADKENKQLFRFINDALVLFPVTKLLGLQYRHNQFNRYDTIVRYLAIENHEGYNDNGFALYAKMQQKRGDFPDAEKKFVALMESVKEKGFLPHSSIPVDSSGHLIDGSHRMALAAYFNLDTVPVSIKQGRFITDYGIDWFSANGFSKEECTFITQKKDEIFSRMGIYFPLVLWPPVQDLFDEITADLQSAYAVIDYKDYSLTDTEFEELCTKMYAIDDIAEWKVKRKLAFMQSYDKNVRFLMVEIPNPDFRKKALNGNDISQTIEKLKAKYRNKYKSRVPDYVYDIVLHAGDNYDHNRDITTLFFKL